MDRAAAVAEGQVEELREAWAAAAPEARAWAAADRRLEVQVLAWEAVMLVEAVLKGEAGPAHLEWEAAARVIPVQG